MISTRNSSRLAASSDSSAAVFLCDTRFNIIVSSLCRWVSCARFLICTMVVKCLSEVTITSVGRSVALEFQPLPSPEIVSGALGVG